MVARLSRQVWEGSQPTQDPRQANIPGTEQQGGVAPKGWGKPAGANAAPLGAADGQREQIASKLAPPVGDGPSPQEQAHSAFSGGVREQVSNIQNGDYGATGPTSERNEVGAENHAQPAPAAPVTRSRRRAPAPEVPQPPAGHAGGEGTGAEWNIAPQIAALAAATEFSGLMQARAHVLQVVFSDPDETLETGLEMAREMMEFVIRG